MKYTEGNNMSEGEKALTSRYVKEAVIHIAIPVYVINRLNLTFVVAL